MDEIRMEKRRLGKTNIEVTALGLGGAEIGRQHVPEKIVERLLNGALDAGLNVIDTAECYRKSEEMIGNTVSHRRKEYYLFTKCGHSSGLNMPNWDIGTLEKSIDRSLKRLKTDYIDVIQLHGCSRRLLQRGDVIAVLQRARDAGKVRYIGYSGDSKDALYALKCDAFDTLQTSLSIADQECLDLTLPVAAAKQVGVIVKRPIANVSWRFAERPQSKYEVPYWERLQ